MAASDQLVTNRTDEMRFAATGQPEGEDVVCPRDEVAVAQ